MRTWLTITALSAFAIVVWPVFWAPHRDSFPLSPYTMFARGRTQQILDIYHVVRPQGKGHTPVPPEFVGTGSDMQATAMTRRAIAGGTAPQLCESVAARVAAAGWAPGTPIYVATSTFDVMNYFVDQPHPLKQQIHAKCQVP